MTTGSWTALIMAILPAATSVLCAGEAAIQAKDVSEANNAFALDLYARLRAKPGNAFFSPFSIATALAMTKEGAKGQTEAQMRQVLHLPPGNVGQAFAGLNRELVEGGKQAGYQMSLANSLWGNRSTDIAQDFLARLKNQYGAALTPLDFAGDPEGSRKTINAWVEKETQEKIKELLKRGMIEPLTRLVLVNAIYFKGNWASQFKKEDTREGAFHVCTKDMPAPINVPLMSRTGQYPYFADGAVQGLELPYQGGNLAMVVLLPGPSEGSLEVLARALEDLEQKLTSANLAAWLGQLRTQEVRVTLPRFKVTGEYQLNETLIALGMPDAFNETRADFTGMLSRPQDPLHISVVAHKAYVDVNEEGTEAAAATAVVMKTRGIRRVTEFRVDRSFVFLIRDTKSGAILFLGRVMNPQEG